MDVIEPAKTEWALPVVFVPKKNGNIRICVNYHRLSALTIRDSYPMPGMDECIDSLRDATIISTLHTKSGYWQVEIAEEDRDKNALTYPHGLFHFTRMPIR